METSLRGKIDHCVAQPPVCSTVHPHKQTKNEPFFFFFFDNRGDRRGERIIPSPRRSPPLALPPPCHYFPDRALWNITDVFFLLSIYDTK
jgi:hypothetical protein